MKSVKKIGNVIYVMTSEDITDIQIEGECSDRLAIIDGALWISRKDQVYRLRAIEESSSTYIVKLDNLWYRWTPQDSDKELFEAFERGRKKKLKEVETEAPHAANTEQKPPNSTNNSLNNPSSPSILNDEIALAQVQQISPTIASLYSVDVQNRSALHVACLKGTKYLVSYLLNRLDNADLRDNYDKIALHIACQKGRVPHVRMILEHFIAQEATSWIDARDKSQMTPLMYACSYGHLALVNMFFEPKFRPHIDFLLKDIDGKNALHHAAVKGHAKVVSFLLEAVNDPSYAREVDKTGRTALNLAEQHEATKEVLKKATDNPGVDRQTLFLTVLAICFILLGLISGAIVTSLMGDEFDVPAPPKAGPK